MHRDFFTHPHVASFSALLLFAFLAAYILARGNARRINIPGRHIDNQALLLVVCSMFGARFFSWLFYLPPGTGFWKGMTSASGGLVFYGGVVFATLAVIGYGVWLRISLGELANLWAAPVALGLGIGRIGCFMAGCCWGDLCMPPDRASLIADPVMRRQVFSIPLLSSPAFPFAVRFPPETGAYEQQQALGVLPEDATQSLPVHPAQLYESIAVLGLTFFLQRKFLSGAGAIFRTFCLGYGIIRFFLEFLRADNPPVYLGLTLSQVISFGFIGWAVFSTWRLRSSSGEPSCSGGGVTHAQYRVVCERKTRRELASAPGAKGNS